jgi:type I restriction enzyme, R subunit
MVDPEAEARQEIDKMLEDSGWIIQDKIELSKGLGVAVREFDTTNGPVDYALFVNEEPVGVVEAKKTSVPLIGVTEQSERYLLGLEEKFPNATIPPCFSYETTGKNTIFSDRRDPDYRSRKVFSFHRPEFLHDLLKSEKTLRANLTNIPELVPSTLRKCQIESIVGLENSFAKNRPRSLIQMATGAGKTYAAITSVYRLLKFAKAKRVLFLVDRNNLGTQALKEFQKYTTPDTGEKFKDLYEIQHLQSHTVEDVDVVITTIQRLYSMLKGEKELDPITEEHSQFESPEDDDEVEIEYNKDLPIESFDFIIIDECHRSIYKKWRHALEYFDAFLIGLTATPTKLTLGFFNENIVSEYPSERAILDGVNVGYNVFRIKTSMGENPTVIQSGQQIMKRDKRTRIDRNHTPDEPIIYGKSEMGRDVLAMSNIRLVMKTFKDNLKVMFPGRDWVPKTLVFAKTDEHAEEITNITREVFDKGNEFCKKITYKSSDNPKELISSFQIDPNPRIAVTVDMVATGTDIQPLECIIFMRDVRSQVYFEQMKGRGTRVIDDGDLQGVTPDAKTKDIFWVVDPIGVCESAKIDNSSMERKPTISLENLLKKASERRATEEDLETIASRLSKLNLKINEQDRQTIAQVTDGKTVPQITNKILDKIDTDNQINETKKQFKTEEPTEQQIKEVSKQMIKEACRLFDSPKFRETVINIQKQQDVIIDNISKDTLISSDSDEEARKKSMNTVKSFKKFIEENKDEITALSIIFSESPKMQKLTFNHIRELAEKIEKPPVNLTPAQLWEAYKRLEKSKVKDNPVRTLTDLISIVRFSTGNQDMLISFTELVDEKFEKWISNQESSGQSFTAEQMKWLVMIKEHIATSAEIKLDDMDYAPFNQEGGQVKFYQTFGKKYESILKEIHEVLVSV